jgi:hypothetical protein
LQVVVVALVRVDLVVVVVAMVVEVLQQEIFMVNHHLAVLLADLQVLMIELVERVSFGVMVLP